MGTSVVPHETGFLIGSTFRTDPQVTPEEAHLAFIHAEHGVVLWTLGGPLGTGLDLAGIHSMVAGAEDNLLLGTGRGMAQISRAGEIAWTEADRSVSCQSVFFSMPWFPPRRAVSY